ncbi:Neurocalcin [Lamellibrachia satsuma]|nr:Neurocalcin [Lamellibrachia satsuma]
MVATLTNEQLVRLSENTHFSSSEVRSRYEAFLKDFPDGVISRKEFLDTYRQAFPVSQPADVQRYAEYMFNANDIDCDGEIDFVDYMRMLSVTERGAVDERLKWAFSMYDINGDGQVSLKEATEILTSIHRLRGLGDRESAERAARRIFRDLDVNGDGMLSESEFVVGARNAPLIMDLLQGGSA